MAVSWHTSASSLERDTWGHNRQMAGDTDGQKMLSHALPAHHYRSFAIPKNHCLPIINKKSPRNLAGFFCE
jgi:hypothetical protein